MKPEDRFCMHILMRRLRFTWIYLFQQPRWDTNIPVPELDEVLRQVQPGKALDLGCGTGVNTCYLAMHGWQVDGVDFIPMAVWRARQRMKKAGVSANLVVGDVTRLVELPLRGPFDLALDVGCLHSLGEEEAAREYVLGLEQCLEPGALYMLYAHHAAEYIQQYPGHGLNLEVVRRLFSGGFTINEYRPGKDGSRASAWYFLTKNR
jgi:SAM-dependent methyltransferase